MTPDNLTDFVAGREALDSLGRMRDALSSAPMLDLDVPPFRELAAPARFGYADDLYDRRANPGRLVRARTSESMLRRV